MHRGVEAERRREPVLLDRVDMKCHFVFTVSGGTKKEKPTADETIPLVENESKIHKVLQQKTKVIKTATDYLQRRAEL